MSPAKKRLIQAVQILLALTFLACFISTFFARDWILSGSKHLIVEKVEGLVTPELAKLQKVVASLRVAFPEFVTQIDGALAELEQYEADPHVYIAEIVSAKGDIVKFKHDDPKVNLFLEKVNLWKQSIADHFKRSFAGLLLDLRLFTASNLIAMLVVLWVGVLDKADSRSRYIHSVILTLAVLISVPSYLDQYWLFRILLNSYMGYYYVFGLFVTYVSLLRDYYKDREVIEEALR